MLFLGGTKYRVVDGRGARGLGGDTFMGDWKLSMTTALPLPNIQNRKEETYSQYIVRQTVFFCTYGGWSRNEDTMERGRHVHDSGTSLGTQKSRGQ